ncbi:MAG: acyl carrier protein [Gemmatimonadaceae bacterium]
MALRDSLTRFIAERLLQDRNAKIDPTESLLERGVVDSVGLLNLITFLETETGVRIPDDAMIPDHFESVESMERLVAQLKGS